MPGRKIPAKGFFLSEVLVGTVFLALFLTPRAGAVDLVNKDATSYQVMYSDPSGVAAGMVEIGPGETKTGLCSVGTCTFTLGTQKKTASGSDKLVIRAGKLLKPVQQQVVYQATAVAGVTRAAIEAADRPIDVARFDQSGQTWTLRCRGAGEGTSCIAVSGDTTRNAASVTFGDVVLIADFEADAARGFRVTMHWDRDH